MKKKKIIMIVFACLVVMSLCFVYLVYTGTIIMNRLFITSYPVRGVDVSVYQGEIDWEELAAQNIQFVFIKATEGSSHVDSYFEENVRNAMNTDLRVGAYHFFSYDSSGKTQAENFITIVPKDDRMLPPVADVEFYGDKEENPPSKEEVLLELTIFLEELENYYGMKPIIYATEKSYQMFLSEAVSEYDIWIRNILMPPTLSDGRDWTFWQYSNRGQLDGYHGIEKYIDMNVFYGTQEEFQKYGRE